MSSVSGWRFMGRSLTSSTLAYYIFTAGCQLYICWLLRYARLSCRRQHLQICRSSKQLQQQHWLSSIGLTLMTSVQAFNQHGHIPDKDNGVPACLCCHSGQSV